ncbi:MAG: hypothetical protein C0599_01455 [Salinivirgaceae bacterium]|nr:MAG: hypothetical protein C0599_01455 [Salinivirgaceae bacterium]
MRQLIFVLAILLLGVYSSCTDTMSTAYGGGGEGEVVVVLDKKFQETMAGDYIDSVLRAPVYGLPQYEPKFKLFVIPWNAFSNTFKAFRNIVKVSISSKYKEPEVTVKRKGMQVVFHFKAPNESEFAKLIMKNQQRLYDLLNYNEKQYASYKIQLGKKKSLTNYFRKNHDLEVVFPDGYNIRLDTSNFIWLSFETNTLSSGVFIYYYPYTSDSTFTKKYLLHKRDSLLKLYVEGPLSKTRETYMTTEYNFIPPQFQEIMVEKKYYTEIRGLWTVVNDYMGGPFINITRLDEKRNRVVTFDGYVYNPGGDKRKHVKWLEAMGYMMKFPEEIENAKPTQKAQ